MARSLSMILMGQGCTKKGHHTIPGKLIDGALGAVDLIHQDLKASIHNLMDFLRVKLFCHGGVIGHISKEDCDQLALTFNSAAVIEDLIG
jgi:hypothetical protein